MRHYDLADRTRNRFTAQAIVSPSDAWTFSVSGGVLHDDFSDSFYGLQESTGQTFSLAADFHRPNGLGAGVTYNYERYAGCSARTRETRQRRSSPIRLRDWTADSTETVNYFSIFLTRHASAATPRSASPTDFSYAEGTTSSTVPAGSPSRRPISCPTCSTSSSSFTATCGTALQSPRRVVPRTCTSRCASTTSRSTRAWLNGIAQPSSLVMGYVYRPYTAHSAVSALCITGECSHRADEETRCRK
jgi:hypothetical protein